MVLLTQSINLFIEISTQIKDSRGDAYYPNGRGKHDDAAVNTTELLLIASKLINRSFFYNE